MDDLTLEEWRDIEGWPYQVSSWGRVRRTVEAKNTKAGRLLKLSLNKDGYFQVSLSYKRTSLQGKWKSACVHQLVCTAFHGPAPTTDHQVAHWNGDKLDNKLSNLRWATIRDNNDDKIRLKEVAGEANGRAKRTPAEIKDIRRRVQEGDSMAQIAIDYNTSRGYIWNIARKKFWIDIT